MDRKPGLNLIQWMMVLTLPVLLLAINLRLVTGHWFLRWEYQKPGFPPDSYGMSTAERIHLAEVCADYLARNADISLLADLRLANGEPAFNARELRHMVDVQSVYQSITVAGIVCALIWLGGAATSHVIGASDESPSRIADGMLKGGAFTLILLIAVSAFMILSWNTFFTAFHRLFFEGDTWIFPHSDTLIRLFPIRFWIDVAATIVGLLVVEALAVSAIGWMWKRNTAPLPPEGSQ
jgi:integral membrane protein (TIGR01906 family)